MSLQVEWDNPERSVLLYTAVGEWSWEEFYTARERGRQLADTVSHQRIDAIVDLRLSGGFPQNSLFHFRRMPAEAHPKFANSNMVLVGNNLFVSTLLEILSRINPQAMRNFHIAHSTEQARLLLHGIQERNLNRPPTA